MSSLTKRKPYIPRIPKRFFEQQKLIQRGLTRAPPADVNALAERAIAQQALRAEAGLASRALGGLSRLASPEAGIAAAAGGAAYGIGEQLLSDYKHRQADTSFKQHGYQEISAESVHTYLPGMQQATPASDPTSTGIHKVKHEHTFKHDEPLPSQTVSQPVAQTAAQPAQPSSQPTTPYAKPEPATPQAKPEPTTPYASQPASVSGSMPSTPSTVSMQGSNVPEFKLGGDEPLDAFTMGAASSEDPTIVPVGRFEHQRGLYMRGMPQRNFKFPRKPHDYISWQRATFGKAKQMLHGPA